MDYHYNTTNTSSDSNIDASSIIPYQRHPQRPYPYNNTGQFDNRPLDTTLQLLTSPTDDWYQRPQQHHLWNNPSVLSPTDIISTVHHPEEIINQPERGIAGFVSKLYQCLQAPDDGFKYARWHRVNGIDMFIIDCIPKFTEIVLPKLFKHCKFASFVRQLNIYGFQRDTDARKSKDSKDKETCRWYHTHFKPGRRDLFHLIRRKTPRYSRRKRPKTEDEEEEGDPETILNTGSGDDDESGSIYNLRIEEEHENIEQEEDIQSKSNLDLGERRKSASSASSSISLHKTHQQNDLTTNVKPNDNRYRMLVDHQQSQQQQKLFISSDSSQQQEPFYNNLNAPTTIPSEISIMNNSVHTNLISTMSLQHQDEEQLRSEIVRLRKGYLRMYKMLTGEVNKAYNTIEVQRSRIEFLESTLRNSTNQQQSSLNQRQQYYFPLINTGTTTTENGYNTTSMLQHHSTPTTPIYHQQQQQQQGYDFLYQRENNDQLSSPSNSSIAINANNNQLSGSLQAGVITRSSSNSITKLAADS